MVMETRPSNWKEDFNVNWSYSQTYMPAIIQILQSNLMKIVSIEIANEEDDMKHSTDLKIKMTAGDVAVRIRRPYRTFRDLTIRAKCGIQETEIHKLRKGYADFYLYLWECDEGDICDWILVDINKMRETRLLYHDKTIRMNRDNYTGFISFSLDELRQHKCLIAHSYTIDG
jgi:hypothetical protein